MKHRIQRNFDTRPVVAALELLPRRLVDWLEFEWLLGVDPIFAGVHENVTNIGFEEDTEEWTASNNRLYPHVCYFPDSWRLPTKIIIPDDIDRHFGHYCDAPDVVLHELGHIVDEATGFWLDFPVVGRQGGVNREERVAEAFEHWFAPGRRGHDAVREALGRGGCELMLRVLAGRWDFREGSIA